MVPALAIADALRARGARVEFIGGERAEAELVPAAGYPFHRLAVLGIDRSSPLRAARAIALAAAATARARGLLRRIGAQVVIGGGGYVAGPAGGAACSLRLPLLLCEADSHLGLANRALAPVARRVFLAFPVAGRTDPRKYVVAGRPVPAATGRADRAAARRRLGIPADGPCLLVFGGSLGSRSLNQAAVDAFGAEAPCAVLHASGRRDFEDVRRRLERLGTPPHYRLHAYVQPFADALAACDLAAARAGGSVFELAAAGLPAILVPYPRATADHQSKNARWMAEAGAAVVVGDQELDPERLRSEVKALLDDRARLEAMSRAARSVARLDAADLIAEEALGLAGAAPVSPAPPAGNAMP